MYVKIRKAKRSDFEEILKLNKKLFSYERKFDKTYNQDWTYSPTGKAYFASRLENGFTLMAEAKGKPVGYLVAFSKHHNSRTKNPICEIENMYVENRFRNSGVGSKLIRYLIRLLKEENIKRLKVGVLAKNSMAINFYQNSGFINHEIVLEQNL